MKQTINFSDFCDAFRRMRPDNFSYEGKQALFDYLESIEADTGEEIELDVIALCCDYSEATEADIMNDYELGDISELADKTWCVDLGNGSWLYQPF